MNHRLGIIGGMGTEAGLATAQIICNTFRANCLPYPKIILVSDESIPDRSAFLLGKSNVNPADKLSQIGSQLLSSGYSSILLACFTAHSHPILSQIEPHVRKNLISIFTPLRQSVYFNLKIGVLATSGSQLAKVFEQNIPNSKIVYPIACDQSTLMKAIYKIKKIGKNPKIEAEIFQITSRLYKEVDIVILGCTELLLLDFPSGIHVLNPIELLAKYFITYFENEKIRQLSGTTI